MSSQRFRPRSGFSLVELLVVVAVVAALVGLVLPAVQQARRASLRAATQSDLRQIGLALHTHHDAKQAFPYASGRPRPGVIAHEECRHVEGFDFVRPQSWAISILGFVEEPALAAVYDSYCLACRPEDQGTEVVDARVRLYNGRSAAAGGLDFAALLGPGPAPPDSAAAGRWYFPATITPREFTGVLVPEGLGWIEGGSSYTVAVASRPARFRDVRDGLANTLVLAESGDYSLDGGGSWAAPRYSWPYVTDCGRFVGWGAGDSGTPLERSLKPRSRIGGGVTQCLSGDGAVRAIDDGIPTAVLVALTSRAGDEAVVAP